MKKITVFVLLLAVAVFITPSCKKEFEGKVTTKTINVTLSPNESYSYQIPGTGDADDVMNITKQAVNYSVSSLTPGCFSNNSFFQYTPAKDFTGTDEVQISNEENHAGHGNGQMHGNCGGGNHHHDDTTIYIFKITIAGKVT